MFVRTHEMFVRTNTSFSDKQIKCLSGQTHKMFVRTNTENLCPENNFYCVPLPEGRAKAPEGGQFASFFKAQLKF